MSELPKGWVEKPLAEIASLNMGQSPDSSTYNDKGNGLPFLQGCGDFGEKYPEPKVYCSLPGKIASVGDVLISVRAPVGDMNSADQEYCIGRGLAAISGKEVESNYLRYLVEQEVTWLKKRGQGSTFEAIGSTDLKEFLLSFPVKPESRQKIANILSTIDKLIENTQTLIDKYTAIKQGMMADLFTRGIDLSCGPDGTSASNPNYGQLRLSVEDAPELYQETLLGWVPKEWEVRPLRDLAQKIQDGTHFSPVIGGGDYLYLTSKNIRFGFLTLKNIEKISKEQHESIYKRCDVKKGDLLLTKDGANTGNAAINNIDEPFSLLSSVAFIRSNDLSTEEYLLHYILSDITQNKIKDSMSGNAITRLTLEKINDFHIPVPTIDEQNFIADKLGALKQLLGDEKNHLEKLNGQKKGLMQDLLTGKVKIN